MSCSHQILCSAVHLLLPSFDPGQVDRERPREEQDVRVHPEQKEEQHAAQVLSQHVDATQPRVTRSVRRVTIGRVTTKDVILTITLMLAAGLGAELVAELLRVPPMLLLLGAGALLGPSVAGGDRRPARLMGAQLILTLGVSFILFHGGLQLSLRILSRRRDRARACS